MFDEASIIGKTGSRLRSKIIVKEFIRVPDKRSRPAILENVCVVANGLDKVYSSFRIGIRVCACENFHEKVGMKLAKGSETTRQYFPLKPFHIDLHKVHS